MPELIPVIAIDGPSASGKGTVAQRVAEKLGYAYEDRVTLLAALRDAGPHWERFGAEYDEHTPSVWERYDWSFRGYAALLQRHLLEAAAADRAVIVGRGGALLLAGVPTALHVRVVAPLAARIERIMRREHADHDSVRRLIERVDRERAGFIRAVYRRAWDEPALYDATYDTSLLDPRAVTRDILTRLAARDQADAEAARRIIGRRLAAARVRAALCTDAETARGARRWNDANVLAFGLRLTSPEVAKELLDAFLSTDPDASEASEIAKLR